MSDKPEWGSGVDPAELPPAADVRLQAESRLDGVLVSDLDLAGVHAPNVGLVETALRGVAFVDCALRGADFYGATLEHVRFSGCELAGAEMEQCRLADVDLRSSRIAEVRGVASLRGARIDRVQLVELAPHLALELGIDVRDADESL